MTQETSPNSPARQRDRSAWRADIQGLRAIAVLAVVIFHADLPLPGGFTGVDMFFVISGYVITEMLLREWNTRGRIDLKRFYYRRFRRLIPALALMVSVTVLASLVLLPPLREDNRVVATAIGAMTISANAVIEFLLGDYFAASTQTNPLLHTWSLSVEEQFYLVFPIWVIGLLVAARARRNPRGALIAGISVLTLGSFIASVSAARFNLPLGEALLGFYSPVSRAWEFGVGALIALGAPVLTRLAPPAKRIALLSGLVLITAGFIFINDTTPFPGAWALLPVIGTGMMIAAGFSGENGSGSRVLSSRALGLIGDWSYSIYLWHWPAVVFAAVIWPDIPYATLLAAIVSFIPAIMSYYLVEQPLRFPKAESRGRPARVIGTTLALPTLVISTTALVSTLFLTPYLTEKTGNPVQASPADIAGCLNDESDYDQQWVENCTWFGDSSGDPVYLVGDSNAAHFDEPVLLASEQLNRPALILTANSCVPLDGFDVYYDDGPLHDWCAVYNDFIFDYLDSASPGTVVLGWSDLSFWTDKRLYAWAGSEKVTGPNEKSLLLGSALQSTVERIQTAGHDVVITQPIPQFRVPAGGFEPESCTLWQLTSGTCRQTVTLKSLEQIQGPHWDTLEQVGAQYGVEVMDFTDVWCKNGLCDTNRDLVIAYRDDIHISVSEARGLTPDFVTVLER